MVLIIVPCYNEKNRLQINEFKKYADEKTQFIFADDGSTDGTGDYIKSQTKDNPYLKLYQATQNAGKGPVIFNCYQHIKNQDYFGKIEWIGYWDADLATPLFEIENMLKYATMYHPSCVSIWGSRIYKLGSKIIRSSKRHYFGRLFATVAFMLLKIQTYDSQCGAKLFKKNICELTFGEPFISKWLFDIEILMRLKDKEVVEYPLKQWVDIEGSKVKLFKELFRVIRDLIKIRLKYL